MNVSARPRGKSTPPGEPFEIERHPPQASRNSVTQHQHRRGLEHEAPDHAECVCLAQHVHVAARQHDGRDLQNRDQIDDAIVGAVATMRMAEPIEQHAVLGDTSEHAGRTHDRGVNGARENQKPHEHYECAQRRPEPQRPDHIHRKPADQVIAVLRHPHVVGNDHHRKERDQRSQQQRVDENHQPGAEQILELGRFDFPIDLGQRFLTRHRENRMPKSDDDAYRAQCMRRGQMHQPSHGAVAEDSG